MIATRDGVPVIVRWCGDDQPHGGHEIGPNASTLLPAVLVCAGVAPAAFRPVCGVSEAALDAAARAVLALRSSADLDALAGVRHG